MLRIRQGIRALTAFTRPVDYELAAQYLSPELLSVFQRMQRSEQLHSLNVLRDVLAQGAAPPDLAVAALLHDVGKSRYRLTVAEKTTAVLVRKALPRFARRLAHTDNPAVIPFWRRAFVVRQHHPAWSAAILQQAGASEAAVWLAAHHQDKREQWASHPYYGLLSRLQQADDAN